MPARVGTGASSMFLAAWPALRTSFTLAGLASLLYALIIAYLDLTRDIFSLTGYSAIRIAYQVWFLHRHLFDEREQVCNWRIRAF